ncbi:MAG: hypothetical protein ACI8UO_005716 [Verrucomicrobiales bacterium]|jgi:hypothetical protein
MGNQRFTQSAFSKLRELRRPEFQNFKTFDNQPAGGSFGMVTKFASREVCHARPGFQCRLDKLQQLLVFYGRITLS